MLKKPLALIIILDLAFSANGVAAQRPEAEKYYKEAIEYFSNGEYEKLVDSAEKAIVADPEYLDAYYGLGRGYLLLKKPKEAAAVFEKMLAIDPKSGDAYMGLGEIYWREEKNYQKAIGAFKKALDVEPNNANNGTIYVALAGIYEELKLYDDCLRALEKAKSINSDYGDVYAGFGDYYGRLKQFEKAKENYRTAIGIYRTQGLVDLAQKYERILNKVGKPVVVIYLKSRCRITGRITEETIEYLKVDGSIFCPGPGDGFRMGGVAENTYYKKDIDRIEELSE